MRLLVNLYHSLSLWLLGTALVVIAPVMAGDFVAGIPGPWKYIGGDEFDGDRLDGKKWNIGHWYERDDIRLVTHEVSDGYLRLYPKLNSTGKLVSRTLNTDGKFWLPTGRTYYVEFRAILPKGPGRWPALWLFSHDDSKRPARPELDIMETGTTRPWGNESEPTAIKATSWTDKGLDPLTHRVVEQQGQHSSPKHVDDLTVLSHVFGAVIDPARQRVEYFVDGERFARHVLDATVSPLYLVISDQYGGPFNDRTPANPTRTQFMASPFCIDYVRVFVRQ